ncbi:MAG: hypothetical protein JWQ59_104 [Cryobacterium sp.]|jgi:hypothetical protein|nr:hypothetical protein [Cryobacterium sp.]
MNVEKERAAIVGVVDKLARKFPGVDRAHVEGIVESAYQGLADKPLRDYIAVLVEHESKTKLRAENPKKQAK